MDKGQYTALKGWDKTAKYFQSLGEKRGKELLRNQLVAVTTLLKLSKTWVEFKNFFARFLGQSNIDFPEPVMHLPKSKLLAKTKTDNQFEMFNDEKELGNRVYNNSFEKLLGAVANAGKPEK